MPLKPSSKYHPLFQFFKEQELNRVRLQFSQIERIMEADLPPSARRRRGFWSNRSSGGHQAEAWLKAGYRVDEVDLESETVEFVKKKVRYHVPSREGVPAWNAETLRALRRYLGLSQAEFAEKMGVRQQTISEWETGEYQPTRSRSKHLQILAERADFPYSAEDQA